MNVRGYLIPALSTESRGDQPWGRLISGTYSFAISPRSTKADEFLACHRWLLGGAGNNTQDRAFPEAKQE